MARAGRSGSSVVRRLLHEGAVLTALLVVLSLVGLSATGGVLVLRNGEQSARQQLDATTRLSADYLGEQLTGLRDVVTSWTTRPLIVAALRSAEGGRLPQSTAQNAFWLTDLLRSARRDVQYAFLTDADGVALANSPVNPAALGSSFADRDWFQGAVRERRTYVSGVYRARATAGRPWVVAVAAPVFGDGQADARPLLGVVAATLPVSSLQGFADETSRRGQRLQLVDQHGRVVVTTEPGLAVATQVGGASAAGAGLAGETGIRQGRGGELTAWRPLPVAGWALVLREPDPPAFGNARRAVVVLAALTAGLVLMVVLVLVQYRSSRLRRRAAQEQVDRLRRSAEQRFGALYRASPIGIIEGTADGVIENVNEAMATMLGWTPQDMVGRPASSFAHPDSAPAIGVSVDDMLSGRVPSYTAERLYLHRDGHGVPVLVSATAVPGEDGGVTRLIAAVTDITELREKERALRVSEQRFRTAFHASLLGLLLLDEQQRVTLVNSVAERFVGRTAEQLLGTGLAELVPHDQQASVAELLQSARAGERPRLELPFDVPDGPRRWGLVGVAAMQDETDSLLVEVQDVTERRAAEQLLSTQALHDPLTHLPNRRLLMDRLQHCLAGAARKPADAPRAALLFVDLDGFKSINDRYGHETGDVLLVEVADRLRRSVRPADTVARLGGDEFVVLDEAAQNVDELHALAERLLDALSGPWPPGRELTASIGLALSHPGQSAEKLLHEADQAMYRAKQRGRNRYERYDEQLRASAELRVRVEGELRAALSSDHLVLAYQPIVNLGDLRVVGLEALVRMPRAGDGLVPPDDFMQVAEDTGLVVPLGSWVLDTACAAMASWYAATARWMPVAVNVSASQAARPDLERTVLQTLARHGVPADALSLELTETVLLAAGRSTLAQLRRLREAGVHVGLDDFGTGFSSLSYLAELPLDFLKVDRSFVHGLPDDLTSCAIVESTVRLALRLGLDVVVEGVETSAQLDYLRPLGLVSVQGFLLARPLPVSDVTAFLTVPIQRQGRVVAPVW